MDLENEEILAQILDRGEISAWRELFALASADPALRSRLHAVVRRVPLPMPHFWLAALASLGEEIDWDRPLPANGDDGAT
jgi:hypothetical protein